MLSKNLAIYGSKDTSEMVYSVWCIQWYLDKTFGQLVHQDGTASVITAFLIYAKVPVFLSFSTMAISKQFHLY